MKNNNFDKASSRGVLYLAFQHIGCVSDTPNRSLELLHLCDLVVFEEDRGARQTLKSANLHRDYLKYNEHNQRETLLAVRKVLQSGKSVIYMSDQGSPVIADPGRAIVKLAYQVSAKIIVIPGPSSISAAISACPFVMEPYLYLGFLPRDKQLLITELKKYIRTTIPLVILDTPYRIKHLLVACKLVFPKQHRAFLAQDISGAHESYKVGDFAKLISFYKEKQNFVLIIDGYSNCAK